MYSASYLFYCATVLFFFFFKQKTAYEMRISDWSSDVCSSDLSPLRGPRGSRRSCSLSSLSYWFPGEKGSGRQRAAHASGESVTALLSLRRAKDRPMHCHGKNRIRWIE